MKLYEAYCRITEKEKGLFALGGKTLSGKSSLALVVRGLWRTEILSCREIVELMVSCDTDGSRTAEILEERLRDVRFLWAEDADELLGKPATTEELVRILRSLAENRTVVITGDLVFCDHGEGAWRGIERLTLDVVEYAPCRVNLENGGGSGEICVRKQSALLSVIRKEKGVSVEDLDLFQGELSRGDVLFVGRKEQEARERYLRAWERAVKEGLRDQEAACAFRLAAVRFFTEEGASRELSEAAARAEEPVLRSRLQSLAEAILGGRTDRAHYSCLLMEDRV